MSGTEKGEKLVGLEGLAGAGGKFDIWCQGSWQDGWYQWKIYFQVD